MQGKAGALGAVHTSDATGTGPCSHALYVCSWQTVDWITVQQNGAPCEAALTLSDSRVPSMAVSAIDDRQHFLCKA